MNYVIIKEGPSVPDRESRLISSLLFTSFLFLLIIVQTSAIACSDGGYSGEPETLSIGMESTAVNSLIYIAEARGMFAENGINLTINDGYPSGAAAVEGMLKGEVQAATTAETGLVRQAFADKPVRAIGNIDMFMHMKLIVRKDHGISDVKDLPGTTIGVPLKSAADFNLGRFLELNSIDRNSVNIVDVQAPDAVTSLTEGKVDAVVAWQPSVVMLKDNLGAGAGIWDVQSGQPLYCLLLTDEGLIQSNPDLVKRLLKALRQAEEFVISNPDESQAILRDRLGYTESYMNEIWPEHQLVLTLDQSLIVAMEDQARWLIENNIIDEREVPDFTEYLYLDGLNEANPSAVRVID